MDEEDASAPIEPVFRATKRRKVFRRRDSSDREEATTSKSTLEDLQPTTEASHTRLEIQSPKDEDEDVQPATESTFAFRKSKPARPRRGGIGFSNTERPSTTSATTNDETDLLPTDERLNVLQTTVRHFSPQTGQVADVNDKHMAAYVDSKLAKIRSGLSATNNGKNESHEQEQARIRELPQWQGAGVGKLQEIDLGPDAAARNIARTEAAARKMNGEEVFLGEDADHDKGKKPRLGKDGKPRKKRWRRGSDDLRRDNIVDAVLHESKLDIYDHPSNNNTPPPDPDEVNATETLDDRMAQQFERDYMDALVQSRRNDPPKQPVTKGQKKPDDSILKGPKLGGSRSARAAMHALELEKRKQQETRPSKR